MTMAAAEQEQKVGKDQAQTYVMNALALMIQAKPVDYDPFEGAVDFCVRALSDFGEAAKRAAGHGFGDVALRVLKDLYLDPPKNMMNVDRYEQFFRDEGSQPYFLETMRGQILDLVDCVAPSAIAVDPVKTSHNLGLILGAACVLSPAMVDKETGGFKSLPLTRVQEHFHRAVREVAKQFNEGGNDLVNPYLGEIVRRHEEDYRRLLFPHQATTVSVMLAHGGHTGGFGAVPRCGATVSQMRVMDHFARKPQGVPSGRRYEPVQSLLF